ncbi:protein disulfide isomerase [Lentinula aciculospora]|uniref:Protein disulfide isomerase n=1 Tax=Lentinula aciculospora TaxID=153920 RepID=A0A9W9A166_9AGAR|nr:protein disulfide isomerase [Lentinula aciculospora]
MIQKLWQLFRDPPIPLLLLSLSIVCVALPVHSTELTPENFKSNIANGVWFIEHFSPYCGHCRAFASTWEELVEKNKEGSADATGVKLAQINCAVHGDLCSANNVKGYPQMNLYNNGELVETFKGARDLERLSEFLKRHAPNSPLSTPPLPEISQEVTHDANPNPSGSVLVLDSSNFQSTIQEGPAFVKFFAPWCGHCKKLAPIWKNVAKNMQSKLTVAEVDCEAHKALCKENNIQGFPTLMYIADGSRTEYSGGRKLDQLTEFAKKASTSSAKPISVDELEDHVSVESLIYVLLYPSSEQKLLSLLRPLFSSLLGSPMVYTIADPPQSITSRFAVPSTSTWAIVALKDHDYTTPSAVYSTSISASSLRRDVSELDHIKTWLSHNRLPTTTELTQDSFQSVMNSPARPLVVLAAVTPGTKGKVQVRMEEIGQKWRTRTQGSGMLVGNGEDRPIVFAWMDLEKWKDWMKSMYGIKYKGSLELDDVEVVIADHRALVYYDSDHSGSPIKLSSLQSVFLALDEVAQGQLSPKHSENFIERVARYLNGKLQSIESYIINHPKHVAFFVLMGFMLVVYAIRKALADEPMDKDYTRMGKGKADRLD